MESLEEEETQEIQDDNTHDNQQKEEKKRKKRQGGSHWSLKENNRFLELYKQFRNQYNEIRSMNLCIV